MNIKYRVFWTIWAIGWQRITSFNGQTIEFKAFIGPLIITWWK